MFLSVKLRHKMMSSACLAVITTASAAAAQDSASNFEKRAGASASDESSAREIIVTATRRSTTIQDVPLSIAAFDGEQLEARKVDNLTDLSTAAPGITFQTATRNAS